MDIKKYFQIALNRKASDLHLVSGNKPTIRVTGELQVVEKELMKSDELEAAVFGLMDKSDVEHYKQKKESDFALDIAGGHFRINLHQQEGQIGLAARVIPGEIPTAKKIDFDETLYKLSHLNQGLILVTGPSGCGKSTTLAVLINLINKERKAHIVTIEDPVEFLFDEEQSIIEQREIGRDTASFHEALKRALRQDPNVIMVGEMRDLDTIAATLTAAETGHLVLSTLHTNTAASTVERIVDMFPAHRQQQVLIQLASVLRAVICQQMLPRKGGGVVVVREIMITTPAISNLIREDKVAHITSAIQTGRSGGMISMNASIKRLYEQGIITKQTYDNRTTDGESLSTYY
ncbi:MAG: type IV pili twitching motility protein PilT [Parcubacteria group bacterium]|nr:type IV pili twitching motility protein PilT [Parcubacteria group bacterium]|tara:strand:+ start:2434 stop:3477 length:1044 start_codon:yes stop_codon:yes gene_type:complete